MAALQEDKVLSDPSLVNLVRKKQWRKAEELVSKDPLSPYNAEVNNHAETIRFPLHNLCRQVEFQHHYHQEEFTDDEEEDESNYSKAERRTNQQILSLAKQMIIQSHTIESPVYCPSLLPNELQPGTVVTFERHRSVLSLRDFNGNSPLHILCSQCCDTTMMKILLENCPTESIPGEVSATAVDLIVMKNIQGCTPLHFVAGGECPFSAFVLILQYCCSNQSDGTIRDARLLVDVDGDIPLHWAFAAGLSSRRLRLLLDGCHESLLCRNSEGKLPMQEYVDHQCDEWDFMDDDEKRVLWNEMEAILKLVTEWQANDDTSTWSPMHAIASGTHFIPHRFWEIGSEYYQHDTYNSDGMLPLHVAVSTPPNSHDHESSVFSNVNDEQGNLVNDILLANSGLVRWPTSQGRLALHLAAESRQPEWIISTLHNAFPDALSIFDPTNGLPPAMLAAVEENNSLDVVFCLLRRDPSILQVRV